MSEGKGGGELAARYVKDAADKEGRVKRVAVGRCGRVRSEEWWREQKLGCSRWRLVLKCECVVVRLDVEQL